MKKLTIEYLREWLGLKIHWAELKDNEKEYKIYSELDRLLAELKERRG